MDRRRFLQFLGLAPLAAKVAISDSLLDDLSSAYDFRFGNSFGAGVTPKIIADQISIANVVALQLEKVRMEIPLLWAADSHFFDLLRDKAPLEISTPQFRAPLLLDCFPVEDFEF